MNEIQDKHINRLLETSKSIKTIFSTLAIIPNKSKQEYLSYLDIATELEDEIYHDLELETEDTDQLYNRFSYLLHKKDWSAEDKTHILKRFETYLIHNIYCNPFRSFTSDPIENMQEDIASIKYQVNLDYTKNVIFFLQEEIKKEKNKTTKKYLKKALSNILFTNKAFQHYIAFPQERLEIKGKERCITFKQEPHLVENIFTKHCEQIIITSINSLLTLPSHELTPKEKCSQKMHLINFKSSLYLLNEQNLGQLYLYIYSNLLKNQEEPNEPIKEIISIMTEYDENKASFQKEKK